MTRKIMLVDSNSFNLVHIANSLRSEGFDVCVTTKELAVATAAVEQPDLIFLDYDNEGLATCQALQALKETQDILVISISSAARNKESTMLALKSGCIDLIQNTEKFDVVLSKLRTYLRLSRIRAISNKLSKIL